MAAPTASPTVLCVDDSAGHLKLLQLTLESRNLRVETAFSGHEALTLLQSLTPDLMIVDVEMPFMDGFELTRRVRRVRRLSRIPIVIMTGSEKDDLQERADASGADRLLRKPIQGQNLPQVVMELLRSRGSSARTHAC
ncbi:MAG: response regulator [Trueperaceae bacterium]